MQTVQLDADTPASPPRSAVVPRRAPTPARGRVAVEQGPRGGVVLVVRTKTPPWRVVGHVVALALVGTFLLTGIAAVTLASVTWVREDFDFSLVLVTLRENPAGKPHVLLFAGAAGMLLVLLSIAAVTLVVQAVLTRAVRLEVSRDGWLVRTHRGRELWRVEAARVTAVEYGRAVVVVRLNDVRPRAHRVHGWDADMAWLAASLRWALAAVSAPVDPANQGPRRINNRRPRDMLTPT